MGNNTYSERDLIIPALRIIEKSDSITTTDLIKALQAELRPEGDDAKILFGRNDSRFSQKVRNLISHKSLCPQYADYDANNHTLRINDNGLAFLSSESNLFDLEKAYNEEKGSFFDGQETLQSVTEDYFFATESYVSVDIINFSVYELKRKFDKTEADRKNNLKLRNGLILDESFQRTGNVWSRTQKSQLIESVLMDIPIPFIYLAESGDGNLVVIDGRQRLTALFEFLDNKFSLSNVSFFPQLKGKKINQFKDELELYKTKIEDAHLYVIKIRATTPEPLKLQIFSRVNRNGTPLNSQEIRHALYQGASTKLLERISNDFNILNRKRMKDRYIVLRYIAMRLYTLDSLYNYDTGKKVEYKDINTFLSEAMAAINTFSEDQIEEIYDDFKKVYNKAINILGDMAFKLNKENPLNMIWFEETLLILSLYGEKIDEINITDILDKLKTVDPEKTNADGETAFQQNIKYHRDSKDNFDERIKWIKNLKSEISND